MRRLFVLFALLMLVFGAAACSQEDQEQAEDTAGDVADEAEEAAEDAADAVGDAADRAEDIANDRTVNIDDNAYEPKEREVTRGTEVTWVNQDDVQHTVTFDDEKIDGSDELEEGDEFSYRFTQEGTYEYHCEVHGADTMSGTVTVTG